jgi:hypothetical protein
MAIQFNLNALSRFSNVNFGDNDAIANLDGGNGLVQNEKLGFILTRKFRSAVAERQNNAVRTELLKSLGRAFGLTGFNEENGTFTDQFMDRLEEILGPAFKRGDFGIKNGVVDSGKPLTQRRIQAVCNAATDYAARARLDKKFEDVTTLLNGGTIGAIIGDDRDEGWSFRLNNFAEIAAKVHHAALSLMDEGDSKTINHEGVKIELTVAGGGIRANLTINGETRPVAGFTATNDVLCTRMLDTINDLYDSFPEQRDGSLTWGRAAISNEVLGVYTDSMPEEDLDTKNPCLLRDFAGGLLIKKAGVTDAEIGKLTNREILSFTRSLCKTNDVPGVRNAIASNQTFKDVSALIDGKPISEIIGDDRTEGWEARVDNLAVMAGKIRQAEQTIKDDGDSATVEYGAFKVDLKLTDGKIASTTTVGITTRKSTVKQEDFHKRIADAVSSPHNSFAGKVLAHYKVLSEKEGKNFLETKEGCPFRDFASWILKTKARVTEEQIDQLTNKQLEEFVAMYCETGDASGIKDLVALTIEEGGNNDGAIDINAI